MDTPLKYIVQKENVHVGGGKTTSTRKPINLKPAGKESKALADFRGSYTPTFDVSDDVDLKPMAHGKQQIAGEDLFTSKNQIVNKASKVDNLNTDSVSVDKSKWLIEFLKHELSDEEIKQCDEWAKEGIEETDIKFCSQEAEEAYYKDKETYFKNMGLSVKFASAIGVMPEELRPNLRYQIDDPDLQSLLSFSGTKYAPEELDDPQYGLGLDDIPIPKLEDAFGLDNDNRIGGITFESLYMGKTTTTRKPIKLKPADKESKALADFRGTYTPTFDVSNDVDLKPMAHGKRQIAGEDLFTSKNQIVNKASKVANLNTDSVSLDKLNWWIEFWKSELSDEEIKQCDEWAKKGIEKTM